MISFQTPSRSRWLPPAVVSVGWLALGGMAGLLSALATGTLPSLRAAEPPFLAGVLWIPLTFAGTVLARRVPWDVRRIGTFVAVHLPASVATSFVLNGAFFVIEALLGVVAWEQVPPLAVRAAVQWLHLNMAGYFAIVVAIHVLDGRFTGQATGDQPSLHVTSGARRVRLPLADIEWIEADGDYARVHAGGRSYLVSRRMKGLAGELEPASFIRVHRSAIVNARRVREVRHRSHGDYEAVLADGSVVRVSRTRRDALFRWLEARAGGGGGADRDVPAPHAAADGPNGGAGNRAARARGRP